MEQSKLIEMMEQQYRPLLFKAFTILCNDQDAEDALQNAYLKAWLHSDSLRSELNCLAWLNRIVYHECMISIRCRKRQALPIADEVLQAIPCRSNEIEACLDEFSLIKLFSALSGKQRLAFYLHYAMGYDISSTAREMNIAEGTVKSQMHYARQKLKEQFALSAND